MKKSLIYKLCLLVIMPALFAGIGFFCCGFSVKVPGDVTVNGVAVGGKSYAQAKAAVRESIENGLKEKCLVITGRVNEYKFAYPEIGYKDDVPTVIKNAKRGKSYTAKVSYHLNGLTEICAIICRNESSPAVEPYAIFNRFGTPFTYCAGSDGARADGRKLYADILSSLAGGFERVFVRTESVPRKTTMDDVLKDTRNLSSFTTYFDGSNESRAHNIRLAADKINGAILKRGESFSFNETVGARTAERGFKAAKIIEKGEFVEGVGGGVCQVSTTLFNAAVRGGLNMTEFHPHSLAVSYVPPSCDAMVSGNSFDLKFENTTGNAVYIRARTGGNYITFELYGRGDGASYSFSSCVTGSIPSPVEQTDESEKAKEGRDGVISEGYLTVTRGGVTKTTLFRRDKYAPVKTVIFAEPQSEAEEPQAQI